MSNPIVHHIKTGSFKTKLILSLGAMQIFLLLGLTTTQFNTVKRETEASYIDGMQSVVGQYYDEAVFALISESEPDREGLLEEIVRGVNLEAASLWSNDRDRLVMIGENNWAFSEPQFDAASSINGHLTRDGDYLYFLREIKFENTDETLGTGITADGSRALGYLSVTVSMAPTKQLLATLFERYIVFLGVIAIAFTVLNFMIAKVFLNPISDLVSNITNIDLNKPFRKLYGSGSSEVVEVTKAVNRLTEAASKNREALQVEIEEKTRQETVQRKKAEEAARVAEWANEYRALLMGVHNHELLTPIRGLLHHLSELKRMIAFKKEGREKDQLEFLYEALIEDTSELEIIVKEVSIIDQLRHGNVAFEYEEINLSSLLAPVIEKYNRVAERRHNRLICSLDGAERFVHSKEVMLRITSNLLSNACKFTENGEIRYAIDFVDDAIVIECKDTGIGIEKTHLEKIFEPLMQIDMSARRPADGMGIGLSLIREFIDLHDGKITVDSAPGEGTRFHIVLPQASPGDEMRLNEKRTSNGESRRNGKIDSVFQMVYSSVAEAYIDHDVVQSVLKQAQENNELCGVTGILLFGRGLFFQVLEGNEAVVRGLMQKINADSRHNNVRVLHEANIDHRCFTGFAMAYRGLDDFLTVMDDGFTDEEKWDEWFVKIRDDIGCETIKTYVADFVDAKIHD